MRPLTHWSLVLVGYLAAALFASAVLAVYVTATAGPARDQSQGMYAFGDALFFLATFAVAAVPATAGALLALRRHRWFWIALALASAASAVTCVAAFTLYFATRTAAAGSTLHAWGTFTPLRMLAAPFFGCLFLLAALFAPLRRERLVLVGTGAIELTLFGAIVLFWITSA